MSFFIPRTCTELSSEASDKEKSRPIESFRDAAAYVLLGDPGAGKTWAFEAECKELEEEAFLVSARDFLAFDPEYCPEWQGKTLFIDGLDEIRAGQADARMPLDRIRNHLVKLGRPRFRISCRMIDWLGDNDRSNLNMVSQNRDVITLKLDPLTDEDIVRVLESLSAKIDTESFITSAEKQGVYGLLRNPQSLQMLVDLVADGGDWPASRRDVFDRFCSHIVQDPNAEHRIASGDTDLSMLLDVSGRLCAVQLLSGASGYVTGLQLPDDEYIEVSRNGYEDFQILSRSLKTKLFRAVSEGRVCPVHRHVAEFLGARHLASLIDGGLPKGRVIALMAGEDGSVVSEFRGLSAWLAAMNRSVRKSLIAIDPIGVGLYGDIGDFSSDEKRDLLDSLKGHMRRVENFWELGPAFESLASPEMIPEIRKYLAESSRGDLEESFVQFLIMIVSRGGPLEELSDVLLDIVRDDSWWATTRQGALDTFIHNSNDETVRSSGLGLLLEDINEGKVSDPDYGLLGTIIEQLYPHELSASDVWDYLLSTDSTMPNHRYRMFWEHRLLVRTTDEQIADLIEAFINRSNALQQHLREQYSNDIPLELLNRALNARGDSIDLETLYDWLGIGSRFWRQAAQERSLKDIRRWLEDRPGVQKNVLLEGLLRSTEEDNLWNVEYDARGRLYGSTLPNDTGYWCLTQSVSVVERNPRVAEHLLEMAFIAWRLQTQADGLSAEVLRTGTQRNKHLTSKLAQLLARPAVQPYEKEEDPEYVKILEERRREEEEWLNYVCSNKEAFYQNCAAPHLLYQLAQGYFGLFAETQGKVGIDALRELLHGDAKLIDAALYGLRQSIDRTDVPETSDIVKLSEEGQSFYISLPILAGMSEIARTEPENLYRLNKCQLHAVLACYYRDYPTGDHPDWYLQLLSKEPEIFAGVQSEFIVSELRAGKEYVSGLWYLATDDAHSEVARLASLQILRKFPTRCGKKQLESLDYLFTAAFRHADRVELKQLIDKKSSLKSMNIAQKAHWLAAGLVALPDTYRDKVASFAKDSEMRSSQLAAFFRRGMGDYLTESAAGTLIGLLGKWFKPDLAHSSGPITLSVASAELVQRLINMVAASPSGEASQMMDMLIADDSLSSWHSYLRWAREGQRVIRRDTVFEHPSPEQITSTLKGAVPANPGDLAALLYDKLIELRNRVQTDNTDDWRQYWNEDTRGRKSTPKHEDHCRDAILSDLRQIIPHDLEAQPEGQYANDKRADIRVSQGGFNVPVEVKKNTHTKLWTAMHKQLMEYYSSGLATGGFGIYLVFWFGHNYTSPPPTGGRPNSAADLEDRLRTTLSPEEARKISVCVIDVAGDPQSQ